ncbi:putative signal transducing protein [Kangiella geojedonensis]|uniref:DUF2007 domain-containing protein n=1 Tax=Kangiella geojedonensis TaxID=914150 RepID=A0A0F6RC67_9GAMM|nr:DUF2007 domain-containing protein [Kangiella geojedonensis]AKE52158.1 hypothetical protein TQ33_1198 [Kangiella geojedonensis]
MKIAYHADDAIDAQLISDLLNNSGIFAQVRGAHMQGAVGEAAAMGNVKVWVNDEELEDAKSIIDEWGNAAFVDEEDAELFDDNDGDDSEQHSGQYEKEPQYKVLTTSFFIIVVIMVFAALIKI